MYTVDVTISMQIDNESDFREAARDRALKDGLDEKSASQYLDPESTSLDECGQMIIDPGMSPAGATIL